MKSRLVQKTTTKNQFENVTAFILTTVYRPYSRGCILNAYSLYFVLSLHTRDSDLNRVTETQTNRRGIFLYTFSYLSVVLYTKITKNMNLRNILINMTKK